jgi:transposase
MGCPPTAAARCRRCAQPARLAGGERLPGYAPELNPVEGVWSNLKGLEFATYAADTIDDLIRQARRGITRVRRRQRLLFAFLDRTGLSL